MENILIPNKKNFIQTKEKIKKDGLKKLYILADFDRTLTKAFVNGKKIPSLISVLRDENYLSPDYPVKANALFKKYHAIETNPNISFEEKKEAMKSWWTKHFNLLIKSNLSKKDIEQAMTSSNIVLREGCPELIKFLKEKNIPLVILSSAGLGIESIELCLKNKNLFFDNIHIISNSFTWDKEGGAITPNQPIIHALNKDQTLIKNFPKIFEKIKDKTSIILLGDSVSDDQMAKGFNYKNILKIGFLNEDIEKNKENYAKTFDAVILNDSSIDFAAQLLKQI